MAGYLILGIILALIIIYLLLIMPRMFNRPDFSKFLGKYYAHRGLHKESNIAPENSMAAFKLAVDSQYGMELDVQLSKDSIPVVFHDHDLKRVCGINKNVNELTYNELRQLRLFDSNEKIPHLEEVLNLVNGQIPLIIELKARSRNDLLCSIVASYLDSYDGDFCIESFNPSVLKWFKKNRPHIIRGQLSTNHFKDKSKNKKIINFALQNLLFNFGTKPDFIAFNHKYSNMLSLNLCRKIYRLPTIAYTIKSNNELDLNKYKFDLFIFESFMP